MIFFLGGEDLHMIFFFGGGRGSSYDPFLGRIFI